MKIRIRSLRSAVMAILPLTALVTLNSCVSSVELTSTPPPGTITIDGNSADWQSSLTVLKDEHVSVGVHNDGRWLSGCLVTADRSLQAQILSGGFTVWFDPNGGRDKQLGLRFPLRQPGFPMLRGDINLADFVSAIGPRLQAAKLIGPTRDSQQQFPVLQIPGAKVRIGVSGEMLVYEFQVSLEPVAGSPMDLRNAPDGVIGMGFEAMGIAPDQLGGGSGQPAASRGRRRMPSGPRPIAGSERQELLNVWMRVHLANIAS